MREKLLWTLALLTISCGIAAADVVGYNLTDTTFVPAVPGLGLPSSSVTVNGADFYRDDSQPTGTGVFGPFLRVRQHGSNDSEEGYNTDASPQPPYDAIAGTWTHSVLLSSLPTVHYKGGDYFRFFLDIGEPADGTDPLLSLDELQIFTSTTGTVTNPSFAAGTHILSGTGLGTLQYDLDGNGHDNYVLLDYALSGSGNGKNDMYVLIPKFTASNPNEIYMTFYSRFGLQGPAPIPGAQTDGTFEEWSFNTTPFDCGNNCDTPVPEPGSLILLGSGFLGLTGYLRRRLS